MRIASLLSSSTEMLCAIGLSDQIVAISHECDYPAEILDRPRVTCADIDSDRGSQAIDDQVQQMLADGAALYRIDSEKLAELAPDLIVTQAQCDVCAVKYADVLELVETTPQLEQTTILALNPNSLDDILNDVQRVGEATGCAEAAQRYLSSLKRRITNIEARTSTLPSNRRPRVVCIEWTAPLMLSANWVPRLVELAGGINGLTEGDRHSTYADWSEVVKFDPEVIAIMPCGFDLQCTIDESQSLSQVGGWNQLSAVKNERVFAIDGNAYFNRSGPRIVDSLEILAHLLHPDIFGVPNVMSDPQNAFRQMQTIGNTLQPVT